MKTRKFVAEIMWLALAAFADWDGVIYTGTFSSQPDKYNSCLKKFHSPIQIRPPPWI